MSHFVVLVIGTPENKLDAVLAPFCEQTEDPKYRVFNETETEYRQKYEEESVRMVHLPDGSRKFTWDQSFQQGSVFDSKQVYPEGAVEKEVPFKELYATFEEFMSVFAGYDERDETHGQFGYYHNPQAKWDWYQVGGRWRGYFKLKPEATGVVGEPGAFDNEAEPGTADIITRDAWDLEGAREKAESDAQARYEKLYAILDGRPLPPTWASVLEKHGEDFDAARAEYHSHPTAEYLRAHPEGETYMAPFASDLAEEYDCTLEQYKLRARNTASVPFAILKDGQWYERGQMGMWGTVRDEKDREGWCADVAQLFDSLPGDTPLIAVDCHI